DDGDVDAFLALMNQVDTLDRTAAQIEAELRVTIESAGGLDAAFGLQAGAWQVVEEGDQVFVVRGESANRFRIAEIDGQWRVVGIEPADGSFGATARSCGGTRPPFRFVATT